MAYTLTSRLWFVRKQLREELVSSPQLMTTWQALCHESRKTPMPKPDLLAQEGIERVQLNSSRTN